jgi:DNA-directed RNA polymerase specialized sigma24 family protein
MDREAIGDERGAVESLKNRAAGRAAIFAPGRWYRRKLKVRNRPRTRREDQRAVPLSAQGHAVRVQGRPDARDRKGLASEPVAETVTASEVIVQLKRLPKRQCDVLQSIAVESNSIKATAAKLAMSEGAVRVALHRGSATLAATLRNE